MHETDFGPETPVATTPSSSRESSRGEGGFVMERRFGGCDIRRRPPEAKLLKGERIEYPSPPVDVSIHDDRQDGGASHGENVFRSMFSIVKWALALVVVLWLMTISSPFISNALTLEGWRFWSSLLLGLFPAFLVLCLMVYACSKFRRLPAVRQFDESEFSNKTELQRRLTSCYLANFPEFGRYASACGFADETGGPEVVECLRRLTGRVPSCYSDSRGWLADFRHFQELQDARAKEVVGKAWKLVAVKTAASPWRILDMIAVVYNSTNMVVRLARIYNRRVSGSAAFRLVCRWIVNIYIAGKAGDVAQGAVEWGGANDLISSTYKPLAGLIGKLAEGGANAFLVYRLGCRAMESFRALSCR